MSEITLIRFERNFKILVVNDFEINTVDSFKKLIFDLYNQGKQTFDNYDFIHLLKFENLTPKFKIDYLQNKCNIKFLSMCLNQKYHNEDKPYSLTIQRRDNLKNIELWYIMLSDNFELIKEDDKTLYVLNDGIDYEFNKDKLKNCLIKWNTI